MPSHFRAIRRAQPGREPEGGRPGSGKAFSLELAGPVRFCGSSRAACGSGCVLRPGDGQQFLSDHRKVGKQQFRNHLNACP